MKYRVHHNGRYIGETMTLKLAQEMIDETRRRTKDYHGHYHVTDQLGRKRITRRAQRMARHTRNPN
jgi:hypothetical protein